MYKSYLTKILSLLLAISMLFSLVACSSRQDPPEFTLSDPNNSIEYEHIEIEETVLENIVTEDIEVEDILYECITEEIYLTETIEVEDQITSFLLEDDSIENVLFCDSVYVSQANIDEFSNNSQLSQLFYEEIDWSQFLGRVAVGTGVIVTLAIVSCAGIQGPVATIVASAANRSMEFGTGGAVIGSLYGGAMGAADAIDESGRSEAIIAFASATAGLILASLSLVAVVPSGGTSALTLGVGVQMIIAGIAAISAMGNSLSATDNWIEAMTSTEVMDIDWNRVDWNMVGVSAVERAIASAGEGFMWGSIVGSVYGGAEGLNRFETFYAPYSSLRQRFDQTPVNGGTWQGARGESVFVLDEPIVLDDGTVISQVTYRNCIPDFSQYEVARVSIRGMTNRRRGRGNNFEQANEALAEIWSREGFQGKTDWTARDVDAYAREHNLVWHELNNLHEMQLVPFELNNRFGHFGGCAEYGVMTGQDLGFTAGDAAVYNEVVDDTGDSDGDN